MAEDAIFSAMMPVRLVNGMTSRRQRAGMMPPTPWTQAPVAQSYMQPLTQLKASRIAHRSSYRAHLSISDLAG
jgi:hypothetical protein